MWLWWIVPAGGALAHMNVWMNKQKRCSFVDCYSAAHWPCFTRIHLSAPGCCFNIFTLFVSPGWNYIRWVWSPIGSSCLEEDGVSGGGYSSSLRPPPAAPNWKEGEGGREEEEKGGGGKDRRRAADRQRGDGRRCRMRGVGGPVPRRGGAAHPRAERGEPREDPGCRVRSGRPRGEPGTETEVCRAGDGAGDSQEGVGTITGGRWLLLAPQSGGTSCLVGAINHQGLLGGCQVICGHWCH